MSSPTTSDSSPSTASSVGETEGQRSSTALWEKQPPSNGSLPLPDPQSIPPPSSIPHQTTSQQQYHLTHSEPDPNLAHQPSLSILSYLDSQSSSLSSSPTKSPPISHERTHASDSSPPYPITTLKPLVGRTPISFSHLGGSPSQPPKAIDHPVNATASSSSSSSFPSIPPSFGQIAEPLTSHSPPATATASSTNTHDLPHQYSGSQSSKGSPPNLSLSSSLTLPSENGSIGGLAENSAGLRSNGLNTNGDTRSNSSLSLFTCPRVGAPTEEDQRRPNSNEKGPWGLPPAALKAGHEHSSAIGWENRLGYLPPITTHHVNHPATQFGLIQRPPLCPSIPRTRTISLQTAQAASQQPTQQDHTRLPSGDEFTYGSRRLISIARPRQRALPGLQHFFRPGFNLRQVSDPVSTSNLCSAPPSPGRQRQSSLSLPPFVTRLEEGEPRLSTMSGTHPSFAPNPAFDGGMAGGDDPFGVGMNNTHMMTSGVGENDWMSPTSMGSSGGGGGGHMSAGGQREGGPLQGGGEHDASPMEVSQAAGSMTSSGILTPTQGVTSGQSNGLEGPAGVTHVNTGGGDVATRSYQTHASRPLVIDPNANYDAQPQYLVPVVRKGQEYHYDQNYPIQSASSYTFGVSDPPSAVEVPHFPHSAAAAYQQPVWNQPSQGQTQSPHLQVPNGGGFPGRMLQHRDSSISMHSAQSARPGSADGNTDMQGQSEQSRAGSGYMQLDGPSAFASAMQQQQQQQQQQLAQTHGNMTMYAGSQQQQQFQEQAASGMVKAEGSPVDYEKQRLMNIKSNEQLLVSLGLQGSPSLRASGFHASHSRRPSPNKSMKRKTSSINIKASPMDRKKLFKHRNPSMQQMQPMRSSTRLASMARSVSYSDMSGDNMQYENSDESFSSNSGADNDEEWDGQDSGSDLHRSKKRARRDSGKNVKWRKSKSTKAKYMRDPSNMPTLRELYDDHPKLREAFPLFYVVLSPEMILEDEQIPTIGTISGTASPIEKAEILRQFYHKGRRCITQLDAFTQRCDKKYDGAGEGWKPLDHAMKIAIRDVRRKVVERCENYKYTRRDLLNKALGNNNWAPIEQGWISWKAGDQDVDPANDLEGYSLRSPPPAMPNNRVMGISPMKMGIARKRSLSHMNLSRKSSRTFEPSGRMLTRKASVVYESAGLNNAQYSDVRGAGKTESMPYQSHNRQFQSPGNDRLVAVDEYSSEDGAFDEATQNGAILSGQVGVMRDPTSGVEQQFVITNTGQAFMLATPVSAQHSYAPQSARMVGSARHSSFGNGLALPQPIQIQMSQPMQMVHSPMMHTPIPQSATGQGQQLYAHSMQSQGSQMSQGGIQYGGMQQMGTQQQQQPMMMMQQVRHSPDMQDGNGAGHGGIPSAMTFSIPPQAQGMNGSS